MPTAPQQRRLDRITEITGTIRPIADEIHKAELKAAVETLRPLGRSARWADSIDTWLRMIDDKFDEAPAWALHQPAVWAANAAL